MAVSPISPITGVPAAPAVEPVSLQAHASPAPRISDVPARSSPYAARDAWTGEVPVQDHHFNIRV